MHSYIQRCSDRFCDARLKREIETCNAIDSYPGAAKRHEMALPPCFGPGIATR